jgi:hypothetical protein
MVDSLVWWNQDWTPRPECQVSRLETSYCQWHVILSPKCTR